MLSIRTAASGAAARIARVAAIPLVPGIAASITTTCGRQLRGQPDRFIAVRRLANDLESRVVFEQPAKAAAHQVMIVGQQDGDLARS